MANKTKYHIIFYICIIEIVLSSTDLPKNLSKELYCAGCEATVHAIDTLLAVPTNEDYDIRVLETLNMVCDKSTFLSSDYSPYYMHLACTALTEKYEEVLEPFFVSHYSRVKRTIYSELVHQVCHSISEACMNVSRNKMEKLKRIHVDEEGNVNIDQEGWKKPTPIQESRDEF